MAPEPSPVDVPDEGLSAHLVRAQASGRALEDFLVAIRPRVVQEVRRLAGRSINQGEVVQDALVNLFLAVGTYVPRSVHAAEADRTAAAWIARIVRTSLYGHAARERRWCRGHVVVEESAVAALPFADPVDPAQVGSGLQRALETLPDMTRAVVQLRCLQGMEHAEIGQRLGITEANCRVRLFRGLASLRGRLGSGDPSAGQHP